MQQMLRGRRRDKRRVECYYERSACDRLARHRKSREGLGNMAADCSAAQETWARTQGPVGAGWWQSRRPTNGVRRPFVNLRPSTHSGRKGPVGEWLKWAAVRARRPLQMTMEV